MKSNRMSLNLNRELQNKKKNIMHHKTNKIEIYTDKDRAAAVTLGDQDIKTSLKVRNNYSGHYIYIVSFPKKCLRSINNFRLCYGSVIA